MFPRHNAKIAKLLV